MSTIMCTCLLVVQSTASAWTLAPSLPEPISNNAVTAVTVNGRAAVFSFAGLDSTKSWSGVTNRAYRWLVGDTAWREVEPVPGPGRLAATAQAVDDLIYVFGGYTVARDGSEASLPHVEIYDTGTERWRRGAPIPVPVDDAVSGVWRDSLIYLVSGWHDRDNVSNVQMYDPATDTWHQATPIPGTPVFGHTGGIAGNTIVYVDGARRTGSRPPYTLVDESWRGEIDPSDPTAITWVPLPHHPGPPLYRAAAVGNGEWVIFTGGTDNPYNYNGVGYDGVPSEPPDVGFGFHVRAHRWHALPSLASTSMDHRNLAVAGAEVVLAGGMLGSQRVTARVLRANLAALVPFP